MTDEATDLRRLLKEASDKLKEAEAELERLRPFARESQLHVLHVFGCAACQGEHRSIWTQDLHPPVRIPNMRNGSALECQRAYVCPTAKVIVVVSNESEDTFNLCERGHG